MILQGRSFRFEIYLLMIAEFMLLDYMTRAFKKQTVRTFISFECYKFVEYSDCYIYLQRLCSKKQ